MNMAPPPPPYATNKPMDYQQPPPPIAIVQPVIVGGPVTIVGDYPMQCTCPRCGQQIVTRIEKKNGLLAWVICGILFFFGLWCCCCIPFCVDGCKDTEHYCPSCGALIGINKKL